MIKKATLKKEVRFSGVGIHSGTKIDLCLKPSTGGKILFRRSDLDNTTFPVEPKNVEVKRNSSVGLGHKRVHTIEHLMAALFVLGINSLEIDVSGEEIPIMDGSAAPFAAAILQTGLKLIPIRQKTLKILKPFVVRENDSKISVSPDKDFRITYSIEYEHPVIQSQELEISVERESFVRDIAPARTFGFIKDLPALKAEGLSFGASIENVVVLDEKTVKSGPLRFPDEFVRHKILDLIGDLSLLGYSLTGHFKADRSGHYLHLKTVHFLLDNPDFWTFL